MICSELNYKWDNFHLIKTRLHFEETFIAESEVNSSSQIFNKAK